MAVQEEGIAGGGGRKVFDVSPIEADVVDVGFTVAVDDFGRLIVADALIVQHDALATQLADAGQCHEDRGTQSGTNANPIIRIEGGVQTYGNAYTQPDKKKKRRETKWCFSACI